jgi:hypothetical protein
MLSKSEGQSCPLMERQMTKLVWNQVDGGLWQAGGLTRHFSIIKNDLGHFSVRVKTGDNASIHVGVFQTLKKAQSRSQRILDQGIGK